MTPVQLEIEKAYHHVVKLLTDAKREWQEASVDNPDYDGVTEGDAYIWFCEHLS